MNYFALAGLVNLIVAIAAILLATVKNRNLWKEDNFFIWLCLSVMIWSFGYLKWQIADEYSSALFWVRIFSIGSTLIPILYLHWILDLALKIDEKKKARILKFGYALTLFFLLFSFSPLFIKGVKAAGQFPFWPAPGPLYHFYIIFSYVGLVGYGLTQMIKEYKNSISVPNYLKSSSHISRSWLIIAGTIIGFGAGATNFFLFYNIPIAPYANILVSVGILLMVLAVRDYIIFHIPEESGFDKVARIYYHRPEEEEEKLIVGMWSKIRQNLKSLYFSPGS